MLKKRIIATIVVKDNIVVQSVNFNKYLPVGKPEIVVDFFNQWGVDEIVYLDISASKKKMEPNFDLIKKVARKCFVPLTVGGGINSLKQIKTLMQSGADKVCLNNIVFSYPKLLSEAANIFGNQCVVSSIDTIKSENKYFIYNHVEKLNSNFELKDYLDMLNKCGIGEVIINSVERDGTYIGYDIELINYACKNTKVPVICSGGAKNAKDFENVFIKTNVSGASASNFFHFYEHSINLTKKHLSKNIAIRFDGKATYQNNPLLEDLRLGKKSDSCLEKLLFEKIEKEII